ncbi:uncharacterized protein FIBRA_01046 [Fibroporia radiculosa]|uniref:rRNA biogenesis protein RRP36 n=1 Tax=Fibroporia radiculosa TaxID=599839 RepID=J4HSN8_9APHY|nr:uncharacterized protein FIBRA_01046 [Fibroporia radiculosa]CCL99037.1 predicted protein [Fibroporia radiculosa]
MARRHAQRSDTLRARAIPPPENKLNHRGGIQHALPSASTSDSSDEEALTNESSIGSDEDFNDEDAQEDLDPDAPRVSQYVHEEELVEDEDGAESADEDERRPFRLIAAEQDELASLSFGALRKAQQALARATALSSEDETSSDEDDDPEHESIIDRPPGPSKGKGREVEKSQGSKTEIPKRKNKHAPTEVTSKKPVPRRKLGAEVAKPVSRDPRFLSLAGEWSPSQFRAQYGFLSEMHTQEMKTLRDNLKRARKLLASSPRDLREERQLEVQRLEQALKRAESSVNKDRREKVEQDALEKVTKEEREKRKAGKGAWYLKKGDKKELLLRAKYDALAASGGRGAVKKAIEKKQKKVNQKEKKKRPFAPGSGGSAGRPLKRLGDGSGGAGGERSSKRQRIS